MSDMQQALRDVILLEADWLHLHSDRLDVLAAKHKGHPLSEMMRAISIGSRQRAKILHDALEASEPAKAEAGAS